MNVVPSGVAKICSLKNLMAHMEQGKALFQSNKDQQNN
jgi:hypothetical protein